MHAVFMNVLCLCARSAFAACARSVWRCTPPVHCFSSLEFFSMNPQFTLTFCCMRTDGVNALNDLDAEQLHTGCATRLNGTRQLVCTLKLHYISRNYKLQFCNHLITFMLFQNLYDFPFIYVEQNDSHVYCMAKNCESMTLFLTFILNFFVWSIPLKIFFYKI